MTSDVTSVLERHRETWARKKIIREIYTGWYKQVLKDLWESKGRTIELGGGGGNFKEFKPGVITSDIEACQWLDICFDAHDMPFNNSSAANIVMIDVLHHLADPVRFLREAARVLESKGRIVLLEPFPTPFSLFVYRRVHPEPFIMETDYFASSGQKEVTTTGKDPWDANQAMAYLLFFKQRKKFQHLLGDTFKIIKRKRISCILYPASGGFENKAMIPDFMIPFFKLLEFLLIPFRKLLAFRCYIVLEKC